MSYYYNAKATLLTEDFEKFVEMSHQPENEHIQNMLDMAEIGHYKNQTVLVFDDYNHFDDCDDGVVALYKFLEETGCAKILTVDEDGAPSRDEFYTDNQKLAHFDPSIIWYDGFYEGIKFVSMEESLLQAIETELKRKCNRDEIEALDEKKLNALIKKVNEKIRQIAPKAKERPGSGR